MRHYPSLTVLRLPKHWSFVSLTFLQVSMLSKGFGDVGDPKGATGGSTTGSQFLEQIKTARALAQLAAQHSQSSPPNAGPSTWDTSPTTLGQYGKRADRVWITSMIVPPSLWSLVLSLCLQIWNLKQSLCTVPLPNGNPTSPPPLPPPWWMPSCRTKPHLLRTCLLSPLHHHHFPRPSPTLSLNPRAPPQVSRTLPVQPTHRHPAHSPCSSTNSNSRRRGLPSQPRSLFS